MNRSVTRVMEGLVGVAALGMTATLAGAQIDAVKEKPTLYTYESLSGSYVPTLEKLLADGTIVKYEIDNTDSSGQIIFTFVTPSADGMKKFYAVLGAALTENSLITPLKASVFVNEETPDVHRVRINATYK